MEKIKSIIEALDNHLEISSLHKIDAVTAARILHNLNLVTDSRNRPGKNFRKLLRDGKIPHAYKVDRNWVIPHSSARLEVSNSFETSFSLAINSEESKKKRQNAQSSYKPNIIKYLLIAEAPPRNLSRYFYFTDVHNQDSLFLYTMQVIFPELKNEYLKQGRVPSKKRNLLESFKNQGFYLIDLSENPKMTNKQMKDSVSDLLARVENIINTETQIIIIKASVYDLIYDTLKSTFNNTIDVRIPFPGQGHQQNFLHKFEEAIAKAGYYN